MKHPHPNPISRRSCLAHAAQAACAALAGLGPATLPGRAGAAQLPTPASLQEALAQALGQNQPLLVMVSLHACPYCRSARDSYLAPLARDEHVPVVQIDMQSAQPVLDFKGQATTHDALIKTWGVRVAPTVLFFGRAAAEVAPRLKGLGLPDFYGAYLEQRVQGARQALKAPA